MDALLAKSPIFAELAPDLLAKMGELAYHEVYREGQVVTREGEAGEALFLVVSGEAIAEKQIDERTFKILGTLMEGDIFGEMAFFDQCPSSATVKARTDLSVLKISHLDFYQFMITDPAGAAKILSRIVTVLAQKLRQTNRELLTFYEAGRIIGSKTDLREIGCALLELLLRMITEAQGGMFSLWNQENEEFGLLAHAGFTPEQLSEFALSWDHPLAKRLRDELTLPPERRKALLLEDSALADPSCLALPSLLAAPVSFHDKFYGFIMLVNFQRSGVFYISEQNLLMGMATQIGGAIEAAPAPLC